MCDIQTDFGWIYYFESRSPQFDYIYNENPKLLKVRI